MQKRPRKRSKKDDIEFLQNALDMNAVASREGPKKKHWSSHDLKNIKPLTPTQELMFHSWFNGKHICAHGSAGTGKAQPLTAKILTTAGWVKMGDIGVGDRVITPSGIPADVIGVYPQDSMREVFTIYTDDGGSTEACKEHLWRINKVKAGESTDVVVDTLELITLLSLGYTIELPRLHREFNSNESYVEYAYGTGKELGNPNVTIANPIHSSITDINIDFNNMQLSDIDSMLIVAGFLDESSAIVPDTIGGGCLALCTVYNENIAKFIQQQLWRQGAYCKIAKHSSIENVFTLTVKAVDLKPLFTDQTKIDMIDSIGQVDRQTIRKISSVISSNVSECQCISVDHPDHLYITDDYIPTHNTFLASYLALNEVLNKCQQKIIIIRSAVQAREVGFLPGTIQEKLEMYELPYHDIFHAILGKKTSYSDMKDSGVVEFHSTSFLRGLTWDNAIVIVDEVENLTFHEIDNVMTRIGDNTRIILTGDVRQTDLDGSKKNGKEGISDALLAFSRMPTFDCIRFDVNDIVRSDLVRNWIITCEDLNLK